jgi:Flp pilus assembly protein TadD
MRAAIGVNPSYGGAYFMLGTALKQNGDLEAAETALRAAIRYDPGNPGPYNTLAQLLRQKGDIEGSRTVFAEGAKAKMTKDAELGKMLQKR